MSNSNKQNVNISKRTSLSKSEKRHPREKDDQIDSTEFNSKKFKHSQSTTKKVELSKEVVIIQDNIDKLKEPLSFLNSNRSQDEVEEQEEFKSNANLTPSKKSYKSVKEHIKTPYSKLKEVDPDEDLAEPSSNSKNDKITSKVLFEDNLKAEEVLPTENKSKYKFSFEDNRRPSILKNKPSNAKSSKQLEFHSKEGEEEEKQTHISDNHKQNTPSSKQGSNLGFKSALKSVADPTDKKKTGKKAHFAEEVVVSSTPAKTPNKKDSKKKQKENISEE